MTPRTPERDDALNTALRALARDEARIEPASSLEARVMAAWDEMHVRRRRGWVRYASGIVAAAACLLLAATLALRGLDAGPIALPASPRWVAAVEMPPPARAVEIEERQTAAVVGQRRLEDAARPAGDREALEAESMTLVVVGEPLTAGETVHVVRMRVEAARLAAFGFQPVARTDSVDVELLVGEDGVARALRLGM